MSNNRGITEGQATWRSAWVAAAVAVIVTPAGVLLGSSLAADAAHDGLIAEQRRAAYADYLTSTELFTTAERNFIDSASDATAQVMVGQTRATLTSFQQVRLLGGAAVVTAGEDLNNYISDLTTAALAPFCVDGTVNIGDCEFIRQTVASDPQAYTTAFDISARGDLVDSFIAAVRDELDIPA